MKDGQFYIISGWMGRILGLRSNDLICFAVIYGFSMDGESQFKGNLDYLASCMFASRPTVLLSLKHLIEHNIILKHEDIVNGKKRCYYSTNVIYDGGDFDVIDTSKEPLSMTSKEPLPDTSKEPLPKKYNNIEYNKKESKDSKKAPARFVKPTLEQVKEYVAEKQLLNVDAETFISYYESVGWIVGKGKPMKDWKQACHTWENKKKQKSCYEILPDDNDLILRFKRWMRENYAEIAFTEKPLTYDGYMRLQHQFGMDEVVNQLDYINANIGKFRKSDIEVTIRNYLDKQ